MEDTFQVGDVVKLKSGGEAMTIEEIDGEDVTCVWFESKRVQRATFAVATLIKYVRPSVSVGVIRS